MYIVAYDVYLITSTKILIYYHINTDICTLNQDLMNRHKPSAHPTPKDLQNLHEWAERDDAGSWLEWARTTLGENASRAANG
jgi:hypothetical protein